MKFLLNLWFLFISSFIILILSYYLFMIVWGIVGDTLITSTLILVLTIITCTYFIVSAIKDKDNN